jgi:hypothetical protein
MPFTDHGMKDAIPVHGDDLPNLEIPKSSLQNVTAGVGGSSWDNGICNKELLEVLQSIRDIHQSQGRLWNVYNMGEFISQIRDEFAPVVSQSF